MPPPSNNSCAGAISLGTLPITSYPITPSDASPDGTVSDAPCGSGSSYVARWYSYLAEAAVTQIGVTIDGVAGAKAIVNVFSGSCGSLTKLGCTNSGGGSEILLAVTPGQTYYFLTTNISTTEGARGLTIRNATAAANDACSGATTISSLTYTTTVDLGLYTQDGPTISDGPCGSGQSYHGAWYKYTAAAGVTQVAFNCSAPDTHGIVTMFSGSCSSLVSLGCSRAGSGVYGTETLITVTPAQTYYFLVTTFTTTPRVVSWNLRDASLPVSGGGQDPFTNTLCATFECGPILTTGAQRRWLLHRFDLKPRTEERS